jgi:serine/threonine protein kinase
MYNCGTVGPREYHSLSQGQATMDKEPNPDRDVLEVLSDRYALRSVLGRGSFGTIYRAEDLRLKTPVTVKLVSDSSGENAELFRREVSVSRKLVHPNIVRVLDAATAENGRAYYVSEWIDGVNLDAILGTTGGLGTSRSLAVAIAVAEALEYVHGLGILHRDLKPSNILIPGWPSKPDFEHPKILDFGVAGRLNHGETRAGMVFGTPRYMSPEQITGHPQTTATDVYGLGLVLFEMLTGKPPLSRVTDSFSLFKAILDGIPEQEVEGVPPDLANLIRQCTDKEPVRRPLLQTVLSELRKATFRQTLVPRAPAPAGSLNPPAGEFTKMFGVSGESVSSAESLSSTPPAAPAEPKKPAAAFPSAPAIPPSPLPPSRTVMSGDAPRKGRRWLLPVALGLVLVIAATEFFIYVRLGSTPNQENRWIVEFVIGVLVMAGSIAAGFWLRGWLGSKSKVKTQAFDLMFGARARVDLTATIALQLDELVGKLRALDERILAGTVALMLDEYGRATDAKDRQAALMNVVALSEKLTLRLSPWYERHKELIASAVAVLGAVSGLVTAINSVLGSHHH